MKRPMKGAQAEDLSVITFPKLASPKIDGFRCVVSDIARTSRMARFPNEHLHETFTGLLKAKVTLDGEIVVGKKRGEGVLQRTSSGVTSRAGEPDFTLWVFDAPRPGARFKDRLKLAKNIVKELNHPQVKYLKHVWIDSLGHLEDYIEWCLSKGFEGVMLRDPQAPYKEGKSTLKQQWLLKIKPFKDFEARIIDYFEEMENTNEAVKDATGKSKRSSAKEGKRAKGTLGGFIALTIPEGVEVRVGGGFTAEQRRDFWERREQMIGSIMTCSKQAMGEKDKPRHPNFKSIRPIIDMDIDSI